MLELLTSNSFMFWSLQCILIALILSPKIGSRAFWVAIIFEGGEAIPTVRAKVIPSFTRVTSYLTIVRIVSKLSRHDGLSRSGRLLRISRNHRHGHGCLLENFSTSPPLPGVPWRHHRNGRGPPEAIRLEVLLTDELWPPKPPQTFAGPPPPIGNNEKGGRKRNYCLFFWT